MSNKPIYLPANPGFYILFESDIDEEVDKLIADETHLDNAAAEILNGFMQPIIAWKLELIQRDIGDYVEIIEPVVEQSFTADFVILYPNGSVNSVGFYGKDMEDYLRAKLNFKTKKAKDEL